MSKCGELDPLVTPYVDGESSASDRAVVEAHLNRCPPCRDRVSGEQTIRDALIARRGELRSSAPDELRRRCAAQLAPLPAAALGKPGWLTRRSVLPLSMAATLVLSVTGLLFFGLTSSVDALAAQLVVDHVKCFQFPPAETADVDPVSLGQQWLTDRGWPIRVPASDVSHELQLLTVRRCASTEGITAHLMYKWRGKPLSVYILKSAETADVKRDHVVAKLGQDAIVWSNGGRTYAVVAHARPAELDQVVRYVKLKGE